MPMWKADVVQGKESVCACMAQVQTSSVNMEKSLFIGEETEFFGSPPNGLITLLLDIGVSLGG